MAKPYSNDLREKIILAFKRNGYSKFAIAKMFGVSYDFVNDLVKLVEKTGSVTPKPKGGGYPAKITLEAVELMKELISQSPDITLRELQSQLKGQIKIEVSAVSIHRALAKENLNLKKRKKAGKNK
jgi:transposase